MHHIVFKGVFSNKASGCSVCGSTSNERVFKTTTTYFLPSGIQKTFRANVKTEVSDVDYEFLLNEEGFVDGD